MRWPNSTRSKKGAAATRVKKTRFEGSNKFEAFNEDESEDEGGDVSMDMVFMRQV